MTCNRDCFNCIYDDCVLEEASDAASLSAEIDKALGLGRGNNARSRKYYAENKELIAAKNRAYRAKHGDRLRRMQRESYYRHREKARARMAEYYAANREKYSALQGAIREARKSRGLKQKEFAAMLGVSPTTISHWERGCIPARWDALYSVFPELKET